MEPRIVDDSGFLTVGLVQDFTLDDTQPIGKIWERFAREMDSIPNTTGDRCFGICIEFDETSGLGRYLAGAEVNSLYNVPKGMAGRAMPPQRYAVFTHSLSDGPIDQGLLEIRRYFTDIWLPNSAYKRAYAPDFEMYDHRFNSRNMSGEVDLYIPITEK
ncbi:GyrI-like domain-containing protein [Aestuariispira ectoiniformans]|uniref:GyrI-like domain-containing protein n=1 Tax=Aestuariispira ectoiniformans TaxID=2775080 RepID=UPI00223B00FF|nr:GyrI-like domain-containing protein [Aestuariispira ectoiniformans]